jgi:hypothetical protein
VGLYKDIGRDRQTVIVLKPFVFYIARVGGVEALGIDSYFKTTVDARLGWK